MQFSSGLLTPVWFMWAPRLHCMVQAYRKAQGCKAVVLLCLQPFDDGVMLHLDTHHHPVSAPRQEAAGVHFLLLGVRFLQLLAAVPLSGTAVMWHDRYIFKLLYSL